MAATFSLALTSLFLVTVVGVAVQGAGQCDIPPRFWCDDKEVASRCGVLSQCSQSVWRENAEKVEFALYYESLCPDCQGFFREQLTPNYNNLSSIMNLTLVPYGNARERKIGFGWKFDCQHGPLECLGNIIETCAIDIVRDISKYFPFISCMESSSDYPPENAKKCAAKFPGFPIDDIMECTKSSHGNQLEHEMAAKTEALNPPHTWVPWFTVNGIHTEKIQEEGTKNLVKLICDTYKGPKPAVCKQ